MLIVALRTTPVYAICPVALSDADGD